MITNDNNKNRSGGLFDTGRDRHHSGLKGEEKKVGHGKFFGASDASVAPVEQNKTATEGYQDPLAFVRAKKVEFSRLERALSHLSGQRSPKDIAFAAKLVVDVVGSVKEGSREEALHSGNNHTSRP